MPDNPDNPQNPDNPAADAALRPRRSVLYMPGANERALEKAAGLPADALILDLEDAVAPDAKAEACDRVCEAAASGRYGRREVTIRVNGIGTPWYDDDILALLRARDVSLCLSDHHDAPSPWEVTARHVYVRGHGPTGHYRDRYPEKTLRSWARDIRKWKRQRRMIFVYFDNDQKSAAPKDARRLMELLGQK